MSYHELVKDYLDLEIEVLQSIDHDAICDVLQVLIKALDEERSVYVFGNGGSSATASHILSDFNKGVSANLEVKYRFQCLNDNVPTLMAISNDIGFEEVFRQQLMNKVKKDDIVIAISGSGNSENVIRAVKYAKDEGAYVIGMTGYDGGRLYQLSDLNLHVNINNMQITEDVHLIFEHLMMNVLCDTLSERGGRHE